MKVIYTYILWFLTVLGLFLLGLTLFYLVICFMTWDIIQPIDEALVAIRGSVVTALFISGVFTIAEHGD